MSEISTSPGALHIRRGRVEDAPQIVDFQLRMALETEGMTLNKPDCQRGVQRLFDAAPPGFYVIAEDGEGVTLGSLLVLSEWSDWRGAEVWWIHSVFVIPEARGQGVYREMYGFVERQAREAGVRGLRLYVDRSNTGAQAVYRRLGMDGDHYQLFEVMF